MRTPVHQIIANGRTYPSIAEFCIQYGFKYTSVMYHLRRGKTGDEIVAALRRNSQRRRYASSPGHGIPVTINHVVYQSVSEAAEAYGIPLHQVYELVRNESIPYDAAITRLMDRPLGHATPCVIAGVTYPTRESAARAYAIPMQTIRARMRRQGLSFEEAVLHGNRARHLMIPEKSRRKDLKLVPMETPEADKSLLSFIVSVLTSNNYPVKCFCDPEKNIWAVMFQESMEVGSDLVNIYALFDNTDPSHDLEFMIPSMGKTKPLSVDERRNLLEQINTLNHTYTGARASLVDRNISISWSITLNKGQLPATTLLRTIYRFIGTAGALWKELGWVEK